MVHYERRTDWFIAQLKPNSHIIAERNLSRQGFQTFLPMQESTKRARGKFITHMRPLFPGYIFVALDILTGGWRTVNSTYGVIRLVCLEKEPTPVPFDLVNQLKLRCDHEGRLLPPRILKPGDQVLLTKGPLAGFVAAIESIAPDRRVYVLMEMMGAKTRVVVAPDQLRAVI